MTDLTDFTGEIIVGFKTQKDILDTIKVLYKLGNKWTGGEKPTDTFWKADFKEDKDNFCLTNRKNITCGCILDNSTKINFKDFINKNK